MGRSCVTLTETDLLRAAAAAGFQAELLEKAIRLLELVETLRSHPFLKDRIAKVGPRSTCSYSTSLASPWIST
jgi:hypothetical protein